MSPVNPLPGLKTLETEDPSPASFRILLAEDNLINQRVAKLTLERAGYKIDVASNGAAAVAAHSEMAYDVILMDCQMPEMDGFEATSAIRASSAVQPIIVAVTAYAQVGERERCLAAGMDDYLAKPFQPEQLVSIVRRWTALVSRRSHGAPRALYRVQSA